MRVFNTPFNSPLNNTGDTRTETRTRKEISSGGVRDVPGSGGRAFDCSKDKDAMERLRNWMATMNFVFPLPVKIISIYSDIGITDRVWSDYQNDELRSPVLYDYGIQFNGKRNFYLTLVVELQKLGPRESCYISIWIVCFQIISLATYPHKNIVWIAYNYIYRVIFY